MKNLFLPFVLFCLSTAAIAHTNFTVIPYNYTKVTQQSQQQTQKLIRHINRQINTTSKNYTQQLIQFLAQTLPEENIPYRFIGAQGEGNLCDDHSHGCPHIQQDTIYRSDEFDCNTLVQYILALVHANSIDGFQHNILEINYGADSSGQNINKSISFKNRNNFFSTDFLNVNHHYHRLRDVTQQGKLKSYVKMISTTIDHSRWFAFKAQAARIKENVRVLNKNNGALMAIRLQQHYAAHFPVQHVTLDYLPKATLLNKQVLNRIPTPAVMEIVRDPKKWYIYTPKPVLIKNYYGTNFLISHLAVLYRQHYKYHQLIYQKISCNTIFKLNCQVSPIYCQRKKGCDKLMMLAATDMYPKKFIWSRKGRHFYCTAPFKQPMGAIPLSSCNKVTTMPLYQYIIQQQYGFKPVMDDPSIIGIHLEKIENHFNKNLSHKYNTA